MNSSPQYRFTLDGTKEISEPIGWDNIKIELNRDRTYWSLVESIELPFEFYGNSVDGDGGYEYLKEVKRNGINSQVEFMAEISWDRGTTYEIFFKGLLDLTTLLEIRNKRRFQCGVVRESNWTRFFNLRDSPVQIKSTDGLAHTLVMPSQKIRQIYQGSHGDDLSYTIGSNEYGIIDWRDKLRDEISASYNLPRTDDPDLPVWKFELAFDGSYTIVGEIYLTSSATYPAGAPNQIPNIEVYTQINDTQFIWTKANQGVNGVDGRTHYTYNTTHTLLKGDRIRIYFYNTSGVGSQTFVWTDFFTQLMTVTGDTTYLQTTSPAFLIHDVADKITSILAGEHYFYSEYFGSSDTQYIDYSANGCGALFELLRGRHIRGTTLADKPFALTFNQLWTGIDPIFCLGLGYEYVVANLLSGGVSEREMLVMLQREYFFNSTEQSVEFEEYNEDFRLEISYDPQFLITSIKNGYQKWQAQSVSGIDDPQTVHTRNTIFKTVGEKDQKNPEDLSTFVAASLAIEQGRRLSTFLSQDWPLDEDTFIIQVTNPTTVKTYSSTNITGLTNSDTRYNVRLTPGSNFNRWAAWYSIAFQDYIDDTFRFANGEGNTSMIFNDPAAVGCDLEAGNYSNEGGDITIIESPFKPDVYKFQVGMTWDQYKAIRNNRKFSIALNYLDVGNRLTAILLIDNLTYYPNLSKAEFKCWLKQEGIVITLLMTYIENVSAAPTWKTTFSSNDNSDILICSGAPGTSLSTSSDTNTNFFGSTEVIAVVQKTSNPNTQGNTTIQWEKNNVVVNSVSILNGVAVGLRSYTFTNVSKGDTLKVIINE